MKIVRFKSRPVEVEAVRFDGTNAFQIAEWMNPIAGYGAHRPGELVIRTLEGVLRANKGDWIVKGLKGEFYPVKPDIMALKYLELPEAAGCQRPEQ